MKQMNLAPRLNGDTFHADDFVTTGLHQSPGKLRKLVVPDNFVFPKNVCNRRREKMSSSPWVRKDKPLQLKFLFRIAEQN